MGGSSHLLCALQLRQSALSGGGVVLQHHIEGNERRGGAGTANYAAQIGATYYAKDAMATVRVAEEVFA